MNKNNIKRISWIFGAMLIAGIFLFSILPKTSIASDIDSVIRPAGDTIFLDVSANAGISATHHGEHIWITTGQAWGDYDNDGWVDLYVTDNNGPNTLYKNMGDGTFTVSPFSSALAEAHMSSGGAVWADYDNDGWLDLYVLHRGENVLFHNDAGESFTPQNAGVADSGMGETAAWGDYDQDGYLDLYVANLVCGDCPFTSRDGFYQNNGDGTFSDVTYLLSASETMKLAFVPAFVDYDNDGDLDLYVVIDKKLGNTLYRNDGPGCAGWCFTDVSVGSGADLKIAGMGIGINDYDHDGDLDFYMSDDGDSFLLQNQTAQGSPTFVDVSQPAGVDFKAIGWGTFFLDYNNDTYPDLYLSTMSNDPAKSNRLFHNNGDGTFSDVSDISGANQLGDTFGAAYADYDKDGWLDLIIGNRDDRYYLFQNQYGMNSDNGWLRVDLDGGTEMNRDAIGSRIYLTTNDGETQLQEVKSGSSLGAGNEMALHFGLGEQMAEQMSIRWANGATETLTILPANSTLQLTYPPVYSFTLGTGQTDIEMAAGILTTTHPITNSGNRADTYHISVTSSLTDVVVFTDTITIGGSEMAVWENVVDLPFDITESQTFTMTFSSMTNPQAVETVFFDVVVEIFYDYYLPIQHN